MNYHRQEETIKSGIEIDMYLTCLNLPPLTLHKKLSFRLKISSVNVTKHAGN